VFNDITEMRRMDAQLRHQAYHDALTGLPNRFLFNDRLEQAIRQAQRNAGQLAVFFLDLDRFKMVNDTLGHDIGDALLQGIAKRLSTCVRATDTVARLGGDEFTLIVSDIETPQDAALVAEKIMAALEPPLDLGGQEVATSPSIGIALYPEDGQGVQELMKRADTAMYKAKEGGRNGYRFFKSGMHSITADHLSLEADLRHAVERRELEVFYQPKFDVAGSRLTSFEALVRWHHPKKGLLMPDKFISLAEQTGLIISLGEWVLREACAQMKRWIDEGVADVKMAVNISARQFQLPDLAERVAAILAETGLPGSALEIEITESAIMTDVQQTVALLQELKQMGLSISVDDFGTGYSSLNYLRRFPIDTLKIDRTFVSDIGNTPAGAAIVSAIIRLAQGLQLESIAEGVETQEQLSFLQAEQCGGIQGYFFSPPLRRGDVELQLPDWLEKNRRFPQKSV